MKKITFFARMITTLFFCSLSNANYTIHLNNVNACDSIDGFWVGKGKVTNWVIGTCKYHGGGTLTRVDNTDQFLIAATAYKDYGNALCPPQATQEFRGTCANGVMTVKTDYGSLRGTLNELSGSASGTLSLSPGMDAKVSLQFNR